MSLSLNQVAPHVGSLFVVHTHAGMIKLLLDDARELPRRAHHEQFRTPMSLLFAGPETPQLAQDTYTFDHPVLGRQLWALTPVMVGSPQALTQLQLRYEVLFA